jgi:hypothetical protein
VLSARGAVLALLAESDWEIRFFRDPDGHLPEISRRG